MHLFPGFCCVLGIATGVISICCLAHGLILTSIVFGGITKFCIDIIKKIRS